MKVFTGFEKVLLLILAGGAFYIGQLHGEKENQHRLFNQQQVVLIKLKKQHEKLNESCGEAQLYVDQCTTVARQCDTALKRLVDGLRGCKVICGPTMKGPRI